MARLYVPLDVDFATDDKILAAGPLPSYLFLCSLAFAKRTLSDGHIKANQLTVVAPGIGGNLKRHAAKLVEVDLWRTTSDGWVITSWAKRNKLSDEVEAGSKAKRDRAMRANHQRWHVDLDVISDTCPLCHPPEDPPRIHEGSNSPPRQDPKPKPETKTKPETGLDSTLESLPRAELAALAASTRREQLRPLHAVPDDYRTSQFPADDLTESLG